MKIGLKKGATTSERRFGQATPTWLALALLVVSLAGCGDPASPSYEYAVPPHTGDGWLTASLADVGMDQAPLATLMNGLRSRRDHSVHSVLVVRRGGLVFEEYFSGQDLDLFAEDPLIRPDVAFDRDSLHSQASASKSITSALWKDRPARSSSTTSSTTASWPPPTDGSGKTARARDSRGRTRAARAPRRTISLRS